MWFLHDVRFALFGVIWLAGLGPAMGQTHQGVEPEGLEAPWIDRSHALRAHRLVEDWVVQGKVPPRDQLKPILAMGVSAARVTLRWSGLTVGYGQAVAVTHSAGQASSDPTSAPSAQDGFGVPVNVTQLVHHATLRAMQAVSHTLLDAQDRSGTNTQPHPEGSTHTTLAEVGPLLQVDVQIAKPLEPLVLGPQATTGQLYAQFIPGYHGLKMTTHPPHTSRGVPGASAPPSEAEDQTQAVWTWPATALARNIPPSRQIAQSLAGLGHRPEDVHQVAKGGGIGLERFEVIHIVRPIADQPPVSLIRGQSPLPINRVTGPFLEKMAQSLTRHLIQRIRDDATMAGTYLPTSDHYQPQTAPIHDTALAAYALGRRAAYLHTVAGGDSSAARHEITAVDRLMAGLIDRLRRDPRGEAQSTAASALTVMALLQTPLPNPRKQDRDWLVKQLLAIHHRGQDATRPADALPGQVQSLVLAALSSLYEQTREQALGQSTMHAADTLWQQADTQGRVNMLPWLAMVFDHTRHLPLAHDGPSDSLHHDRRRQPCVQLVPSLRRGQITLTPEWGPADEVGGFRLKPGHPPDWQTARVLVFLASLLGQSHALDHQDLAGWVVDASRAARFLAQLMFDQAGCYYVRSPDDALGGVRLALWDNRLSVGPTAMTLLAITEFQQALARLTQQPAGHAPSSHPGAPTDQQ